MSLSVVILGFDGRRKTLKVKQNDVILKTLQDFCQREGLDASLYEFMFRQKPLNVTLTWRFANIPNNAKLELEKQEQKRAENPVKIALQIPGIKRLQQSFPPSTTFAAILKEFKDMYGNEVKEGMSVGVLYVQKEYFGLQLNDSLKSVGLTGGNALLKVIQKSEDEVKALNADYIKLKSKERPKISKENVLKVPVSEISNKNPSTGTTIETSTTSTLINFESNVEEVTSTTSVSSTDTAMSFEEQVHDALDKYTNRRSAQSNSEETVRKKFKQSPSPSPPQMSFENFKFPEESANMDLRDQNNEDEVKSELKAFSEKCEREVVFYNETKGKMSTEMDDLSDDFYEVTIDDLKMMLSDLRNIQQEADNKPLLTKASKEMEKLKAMKMYPKIMIRIVFPERLILQGIFQPGESTQNLYDFVSDHLNSNENSFYLYTTPPKIVLKEMDRNLFDYKLSPASKVYFGLKDGDFSKTILSDKLTSNIQSVAEANEKVGIVYQSIERERMAKSSGNTEPIEMDEVPSTSSGNPQATNSNVRRQTSSTKVPKWFKMSKK